ncbi:RNA-directed DNA polymerase [Caenimonas sedimenti]|uniref:RNA-directed DNA polymerase n=1 Tax=Caenimonas sedimenti TaxID=2596921 RepID=A0A562ZLA2_9BURK|nr:reverse transcriptase family protein [Caenimonas sedimenti]TWO69088.1 RNA-directed DNA polymerase [Caenimonas sedimenti]
MSAPQPTRAELLERLRKSSKDAVILEEMQRLGFWPAGSGAPTVEEAMIQREVELAKALEQVRSQLGTRTDPESALKQMRKERMAEARARREANAQAREQRRLDNALRWHERSGQEIAYLGDQVSAGLYPGHAAVRPERLARHGLPLFETPLQLATAMGVPLAELKFLGFHREVARTSHYRRFRLPKKTGGERTISAPMPRLKRAQYWVLDNILARVPVHAAAHGFVPGRSITSNAAPHCGQAVVINLDLKDFFPGVAFPRIRGVFRGLGYGEDVATVLALLCSENPADELVVDGELFFVGRKGRDRTLPQGAPTSPMLTNVLCRKLDRRLQGLAGRFGFAYTRYADDLTFSAPPEGSASVGRLLRQVHHILHDEGFTPHPDKQRVMRSGARQEVTGVVVNREPSVARSSRRRLRAALHRAQKSGVAQAHWEGAPANAGQLQGHAQFVRSVNARQGAPLVAQARMLVRSPHTLAAAGSGAAFRQRAAAGQAPMRPGDRAWWSPAAKAAPQLQLTQEQKKAERAERRARRRDEARAAAQPARGERAAGAGPGPFTTPPEIPISWWRFGFQLFFVLWFASATRSSLVFMGGAAWFGWSLAQRRQGWPRFLLGMLIVFLASVVIQGFWRHRY